MIFLTPRPPYFVAVFLCVGEIMKNKLIACLMLCGVILPCRAEYTTVSFSIARYYLCSGYVASRYNSDIHVLDYNKGCYRYVCANPGHSFTSLYDHTCVECVVSARTGIHPINNTCITCDIGKIFNRNDVANRYCSPATRLSKTDMMYGHGKTKATAPSKVSEQCWTIGDIEEYKNCVMGL